MLRLNILNIRYITPIVKLIYFSTTFCRILSYKISLQEDIFHEN